MEPKIRVQNVVATASVGGELDLADICRRVDRAKYNPDNFPGLVLRLADPKATVLVFASGKMVCAGTKSTEMAVQAVYGAAGLLRKHGIDADGRPALSIQNVVATVDMGKPVRLEKAATVLPRAMYEPEMFRGIIHRVIKPKVTILLFNSGKAICAGAKSLDDIRCVSMDVYRTLESNGLFKQAA